MKMNDKQRLIFLLAFLFAAVAVLLPELALARPGGGHSYSGGGGGGGYSGGGSSSGDGLLFDLIIILLMELPPQVSIPLVLVILVVYYLKHKRRAQDTQTISSGLTRSNMVRQIDTLENSMRRLRERDPNFSKTLFLDFSYSLFHQFYHHAGRPEFKNLRPFLSPRVYDEALKGANNNRVQEVVIGGITLVKLHAQGGQDLAEVEFEANYTLVNPAGSAVRILSTERWTLARQEGILSQEPQKMQKLACPNCGATANFADSGECQHCGTFIEAGKSQWALQSRNRLKQESLNVQGLAHYAPEVGTNWPTLKHPDLPRHIEALASAHGSSAGAFQSAFEAQVAQPVFMELYKAWSGNQWQDIRHLVSDRLYEAYSFWMQAYQAGGLRNKLEDIRIKQVEIVQVETDRFYEAVTARIFAQCKDFVVDRQGKKVGGNDRQDRFFSEYWTFVRRSSVEKMNVDLKSCPNCGAPNDKMGQAAECGYCGSKVSTGEFSWILAYIVQDEAYKG